MWSHNETIVFLPPFSELTSVLRAWNAVCCIDVLCAAMCLASQAYTGGSVDGACLLNAEKTDVCLNWSGKRGAAKWV